MNIVNVCLFVLELKKVTIDCKGIILQGHATNFIRTMVCVHEIENDLNLKNGQSIQRK